MKNFLNRIWGMVVGLVLLFPLVAMAGGEKASDLVVVADTRRVDSAIMKYFSDLYNTNILLFAVWAVVLTAAYGVLLGLIMDFIMARTGIDLRSRKLVEH